MQYQLAALDMDGTLLNSRHEMSEYTVKTIQKAVEKGKLVALATGRCLSELRHVAAIDNLSYFICENGACVYDTRSHSAIRQVRFTDEQISYLMQVVPDNVLVQFFMDNISYLHCAWEDDLSPYHLEFFRSVFREGSIFAPDMYEKYESTHCSVEKIDFYFQSEEDRDTFMKNLRKSGRDDLLCMLSIAYGVECSPSQATKAQGLAALCEYLHMPLSEVMCVGDGGNDFDIMEISGLAVAMGNALDEIKDLADVITDDNDHDGVAKAMEKYMLAC